MISRPLYIAFLYYLVLEGAIRKWVWPEASNELFLVKDVILGMALVAALALERRYFLHQALAVYRPGEMLIWQAWVLLAIVGAAASGMSLSGLAGLRYYLAALPVLVLQPMAAPTLRRLEQLLSVYVLVCFAVCILGIVQFMSPPDSILNRYSWSDTSGIDVATFGEISEQTSFMRFTYVRIVGTFSYISPYASYLQFAFFVTIALALTATSERSRILFAVVLLFIVVNLFMTGSRASVITCLFLSVLFVPSARKVLKGRFAFIGVLGSAAAIGGGLWILQSVIVALAERHELAGDANARIYGTLFLPIFTFLESPIIGEGVGTTFLGLGQLTGSDVFQYNFDEVFQDRLAVEVGIFGYAFFVFVKLYFLWATFSLFRRTTNLEIRVWALVSLSYQASLLWAIPIYNSVANVFYFVCIALFAWLRRLDRGNRRVDEGRSGAIPAVGVSRAGR